MSLDDAITRLERALDRLEQAGRSDAPLAYCQTAQRIGLSRRRALEVYRAAGGKIRTADFLEVWRAAEAAETAFGTPGAVRARRAV